MPRIMEKNIIDFLIVQLHRASSHWLLNHFPLSSQWVKPGSDSTPEVSFLQSIKHFS